MPHLQPALSPVHARVLRILRRAKKPMGAYAVLQKLGEHGINAPPTVYRALHRLRRLGLIHRIESLNAYIACAHDDAAAHATAAAFGICNDCGEVAEFAGDRVLSQLQSRTRKIGFQVTDATLELKGLCAKCTPSRRA